MIIQRAAHDPKLQALTPAQPRLIPPEDQKPNTCTTVGCSGSAILAIPLNEIALHPHKWGTRKSRDWDRGQRAYLYSNVIETRLCAGCIGRVHKVHKQTEAA